MNSLGIVILAAGQGTRLRLDCPKPLVPLRGRCLIDYVIDAAAGCRSSFKQSRFGVVTGHRKEEVERALSELFKSKKLDYDFAFQKEQKGTADAVRSYFRDCHWATQTDWTLVLCADTPLLTSQVLEQLRDYTLKYNLNGAAASFTTDVPYGYGRIVREKKGFRIVEQKDASKQEEAINEVNSGVYFLKTSYLVDKLSSVTADNKAKEFYLTDVFQVGESVEPVLLGCESTFLGVNDLIQLSESERVLNQRKCHELMLSGVRISNPNNVVIEDSVQVEAGSLIMDQSHLLGQTKVGAHVTIEPGCVIKSSKISDNVTLHAYSHIVDSVIGQGASIGPFARLRPGTDLGERVKIGNFVETKKSRLLNDAKVSHLSYIGDAEVGERSNIGCGFITCNYDGVKKHFTKIGADCFVGSDSQAVAPVEIGDRSFIACSSTVTQSVPADSFVISRGKQVVKPGLAKRFIRPKEANS